MNWETLAQLHDILKLTGEGKMHFAPGSCYELNCIKTQNPELWIALSHHTLWSLPFPLPREALWLCLADHKASAISRRLRGLKGSHSIFRVWRDDPPATHAEWAEQPRKTGPDDLAALLCEPIDPDALYKNLRSDLQDRSEAAQWKGGGCPFASLDTHGDLTRRWFSFFSAESEYFEVPPEIDTKKAMWALRKGALPKKTLLLIRLRVRTAGRLARLRDAVILADIPKLCESLSEPFGRHTIYDLHDEVLIVARPNPWAEVEQRLQIALGSRTNYFLDVTAVETPMGHRGRKTADGPANFLHNFPYLFGGDYRSVYPVLKTEILPDPANEASREAILCDLCQMAEARKVYPFDVYNEDDPVQEYLCEECATLRHRAKRLKQLAKWEEESEGKSKVKSEGEYEPDEKNKKDIRVCFVKVSLDLRDWWNAAIGLFQAAFPKELAEREFELREEDLGFSILAEFLNDYRTFLDRFRNAVFALSDFDFSKEDNREEIMPGLLALRIQDDSEGRAVIMTYLECFREFFPKCRQEGTPIRLSVSCSNLKFPFLSHWDFLNEPRKPINIQSVRRARLELDFAQWDALQAMGLEQRRISSFLHRLASIQARTGSTRLVEIELLDRRAEYAQVADPFRANLLKAQHILDYYKIARRASFHD